MSTILDQVRRDLPVLNGPLPGPRARAVIERDAKVLSPSYTRCYPLVAHKGEGAIVEDVDGNRFLDFNAGIAVVATGHCHPQVVEAIQKQAARLIHMSGTDFYYEELVALAEKLAEIAPGDVARRVSFGNSGAEAVEGAIKLARYATGRDKIIAFFGSFHGRTMGALSLTARKAVQRAGFGPLVPGVIHAPYPTATAAPTARRRTAARSNASSTSKTRCSRPSRPPRRPPPSWWSRYRARAATSCRRRSSSTNWPRVARSNGILLVFDEVQSGMGRTGKMWAAEHFDVVPDIFTVAKGIASGMPLGATVARADLMTWPPGAHASTFGGNPVACAAALVTIELLEQELVRKCGPHGRPPDGPHAPLAGALPHRRRRARAGPDARHRTGARPGDQEKPRRSCATAWSTWLRTRPADAGRRRQYAPPLPAAGDHSRPVRFRA